MADAGSGEGVSFLRNWNLPSITLENFKGGTTTKNLLFSCTWVSENIYMVIVFFFPYEKFFHYGTSVTSRRLSPKQQARVFPVTLCLPDRITLAQFRSFPPLLHVRNECSPARSLRFDENARGESAQGNRSPRRGWTEGEVKVPTKPELC